MDKEEKLAKIKAYENKLKRQCADMDAKRKEIAKGLCKVDAFEYVQALELMDDIIENGWVEMFTQSEKLEPYERTRPVVDVMMKLFEKYTKSISQLNNMLPPSSACIKSDDTLSAFIASRRD